MKMIDKMEIKKMVKAMDNYNICAFLNAYELNFMDMKMLCEAYLPSMINKFDVHEIAEFIQTEANRRNLSVIELYDMQLGDGIMFPSGIWYATEAYHDGLVKLMLNAALFTFVSMYKATGKRAVIHYC